MSSVIYFVRRESDGLIKIGTSTKPDERLKVLASIHGKINCLGVIRGGRVREKILHWCFSGSHAFDEWFLPTEEIMGIIDEYAVDDCSGEMNPPSPREDRTSVAAKTLNTKRLNEFIRISGVKKKEVASALNMPGVRLSEKINGRIFLYPHELVNILKIIGLDENQLKDEKLIDWYTVNGSE